MLDGHLWYLKSEGCFRQLSDIRKLKCVSGNLFGMEK